MLQVRSAVQKDLPSIIELIRESFHALSDHYGNESHNGIWEKGVTDALKEDLNEEGFSKTYFTAPASHFWVAETPEDGVVGCVALKRKCSDEAELVRMAVKGSIRGKGIGGQLVTSLLSHCKQHKLCRVLLTTANPQSAQFYSKCGFKTAKSFEHTLAVPDVAPITFTVSSMVYYAGAKIIRKVGLVGGTHGNELLGIELVKGWQQQDGQPQDELRRSTLKCVPVLSNLPAIAVNRRFIDKDLNRQFKRETLDAILRNTSAASVSGADAATVEMEDYSATRLNALLGPKTEFYTEPTQVDFIVDMHSSTSNLGNMLILGCLTHDNLAAHTAFTVKQRLNAAEGGAPLSNGTLRVASTDVTKEVSHWVDSLAPSGLAIEVGPLAHGTMNASLLEDTRRIVTTALDFLEERNLALLQEAQRSADAVRSSGNASAADLEDASTFDFHTATYIPRSLVPVTVVPEVVASAAPGAVGLEYFFMSTPLHFPTAEAPAHASAAADTVFASLPAAVAAKLGEAQSKVGATPAKQAILHPTMDNRDWAPLVEGAPLFRTLDGRAAVIPFTRAEHCPAEKDSAAPLYPVFINEAAYQGNNMACWIVKDATYALY